MPNTTDTDRPADPRDQAADLLAAWEARKPTWAEEAKRILSPEWDGTFRGYRTA